MNKILLLLDDYSEMMFIQIILKKLGFDVDALQNSRSLSDRLVGFHPHLLIMNEFGKKFDSAKVLQQVTTQRPDLKVIYLTPNPSQNDVIDVISFRISSPVQPAELIHATAECCEADEAALIEKFQKFRGQLKPPQGSLDDLQLKDGEGAEANLKRSDQESNEASFRVSGESLKEEDDFLGLSKINLTKEQEYRAYLKEKKESVKNIFDPAQVHKVMKEERGKASSPKVDGDRKDFVRTLFKK